MHLILHLKIISYYFTCSLQTEFQIKMIVEDLKQIQAWTQKATPVQLLFRYQSNKSQKVASKSLPNVYMSNV